MTEKEVRKTALKLIHKSRCVYVSTLNGSGAPETRVMFNLNRSKADAKPRGFEGLPDFANYLSTNTSSEKTAQILKNPAACLYYSDNRLGQGLTLTGRLDLVTDLAVKERFWKKSWTLYYPLGLTDPDFSVLRFTPVGAKFYGSLSVTSFDPAAGTSS
jgi:general stress protein 26